MPLLAYGDDSDPYERMSSLAAHANSNPGSTISPTRRCGVRGVRGGVNRCVTTKGNWQWHGCIYVDMSLSPSPNIDSVER